MKKRYKRFERAFAAVILLALLLALTSPLAALAEEGAEKVYYVCFSNENYSVRNANKMTRVGDEYLLEDVRIGAGVEFYVTDGEGIRYCAESGDYFTTEEAATYSYTVRFNPNAKYTDEGSSYKATGAHVTFGFYVPMEVSILVGGTEMPMNYNSYFTAYDLYYLSSVRIEAGATVSYDGEEHTVRDTGYYRILFTPGETREGDSYLFNSDGEYGSGDGYEHKLYISDAPRYYITFENEELIGVLHDVEIGGKAAYLFSRFEDTTAAAEYRACEVFVPSTDYTLKYKIYEELPSGGYTLINDDNDDDTVVSKLEVGRVGNYEISLTDGGDRFAVRAERVTYDHGGFYLVGNMNGWGFDASGAVDLYDEYKLTLIEETDSEYDEDYNQYRLTFYVGRDFLREEESAEFYITDGEDVYMNLTEYISIDEAGEYELLFSDEHDYGRGRNYRYSLVDGEADYRETVINSTEEFLDFARSCNTSAEYSEDLIVYLAADLDFTGVQFVPVKVFNGIFRGGYHKLSGIVLNEDSEQLSVFGRLTRDAVIERLSVALDISDKDGDYVGFIGKNYGTVDGVTVSGTLLGNSYVGGVVAYNGRGAETTGAEESAYVDGTVKNCVSYVDVRGYNNVGGAVGFNNGELRASESRGSTSGVTYTPNTTPINLGGLVGYSAGRIVDSENYALVKSDIQSLNVGGIAGQCTGDVYYCYNFGDVFGEKYVGGIVGYYGTVAEDEEDLGDYFGGMSYEELLEYLGDDDGEYEEVDGRTHAIFYAVNEGSVTSRSYAGGVVGYTTVALPIENSVNAGRISTTAGGYVGGIAGYADSAVIEGCLSTSRISAGGSFGANYVGGIVGYGNTVRYSMSSADIIGSDYVGGIGGYLEVGSVGCYTNVIVIYDEGSASVGSIAGYCNSMNESFGNFGGSVAYNYYVGTLGGIGALEYGSSQDYAAKSISASDLATVGELSPYLDRGFSSEFWIAGDEVKSYPVLRFLTEVCECAEYDDEDGFEALFGLHGERLASYAMDAARPSYYVSFLEWNEDNGDLTDEGGKVLYDNFEVIHSVRVFDGDPMPAIPDFIHAELDESGRWQFDGSKAAYFVKFVIPDGSVGESIKVYAQYSEIATTLKDPSGKLLAEGKFIKGTTVKLVSTAYGLMPVFELDGKTLEVDNFKVKYLAEGDPASYRVDVFGGEPRDANAEISGRYLAFSLSGGESFALVALDTAPEAWLVGVLTGVGGAVLASAVFVTVILIRRRKKTSSPVAPDGEER